MSTKYRLGESESLEYSISLGNNKTLIFQIKVNKLEKRDVEIELDQWTIVPQPDKVIKLVPVAGSLVPEIYS